MLSLIHIEEDGVDRDYICETVIDRKSTMRMTRYHVRDGDTIKIVRLDFADDD